MLQRDVFTGNISTPGAAAQTRRHRHAIGKCAGIGFGLRLAHHHAADRCGQGQLMNVVVFERIDAAGVTFASDIIYLFDHFQSCIKAGVFVNSHDHTEFLARKEMFFSDLILFDYDKLPVGGNLKTGNFGNLAGRLGDGINGAVPFGIPQGRLQQFLFLV